MARAALPILVCELDPKISTVAQALADAGFEVSSCPEGAARRLVEAGMFEALVISLAGPAQTRSLALKLCSDLRASGYRGAIAMAGTHRRRDGVEALERGADTFVPRPLDASEIVARLRAVLRRTGAASRLGWGEVEIDTAHRTAYLRSHALALTGREYSLLVCLVELAGATASRSELLRRVWKRRDDPGTTLVEVTLSRLRQKLGRDAAMIETVRRAGYRLRPIQR
jgi:DNA-binding response OmpR family regulator